MKALKYFKIIIGGLIIFVSVIIIAKTATDGYSVNWLGFAVLFVGAALMLYSGLNQREDPHSFNINDYDPDNLNWENESLEHLGLLNKSGVISKDEFLSKKQDVEVKKANIIVKESKEYMSLKHLFDENLLTQEEFDSKKKELITRLL